MTLRKRNFLVTGQIKKRGNSQIFFKQLFKRKKKRCSFLFFCLKGEGTPGPGDYYIRRQDEPPSYSLQYREFERACEYEQSNCRTLEIKGNNQARTRLALHVTNFHSTVSKGQGTKPQHQPELSRVTNRRGSDFGEPKSRLKVDNKHWKHWNLDSTKNYPSATKIMFQHWSPPYDIKVLFFHKCDIAVFLWCAQWRQDLARTVILSRKYLSQSALDILIVRSADRCGQTSCIIQS